MIRLARRVLATISLAGLIAALIRVRGKGGVPPQSGGWREISPAELKQSAPSNH